MIKNYWHIEEMQKVTGMEYTNAKLRKMNLLLSLTAQDVEIIIQLCHLDPPD